MENRVIGKREYILKIREVGFSRAWMTLIDLAPAKKAQDHNLSSNFKLTKPYYTGIKKNQQEK